MRRFLKRYCASGIANKVKYLQLLAEIKVEIEAKYMLFYMYSRRSVMLQTAEQQSAIKSGMSVQGYINTCFRSRNEVNNGIKCGFSGGGTCLDRRGKRT